MLKKLLLAAVIGASFASIPVASYAQSYTIRVAPPEPRQEALPQARRGYAWVPGHWEWRARKHVWVSGYWVRERRGFTYQPHRWVERDGRWRMEQGRWARSPRDRDGDGIPNRVDRAPNNPNR